LINIQVIRIHVCPWDLAAKNGGFGPKTCHTLHTCHTAIGHTCHTYMTANCHTFNTSHTHSRRHKTMSKNKFPRALGAVGPGDTNPFPVTTYSGVAGGSAREIMMVRKRK
jgi:hypothetical protein